MLNDFIHGAAIMAIIVTLCTTLGILRPTLDHWIGLGEQHKPHPPSTTRLLICATILITTAGLATATSPTTRKHNPCGTTPTQEQPTQHPNPYDEQPSNATTTHANNAANQATKSTTSTPTANTT